MSLYCKHYVGVSYAIYVYNTLQMYKNDNISSINIIFFLFLSDFKRSNRPIDYIITFCILQCETYLDTDLIITNKRGVWCVCVLEQ